MEVVLEVMRTPIERYDKCRYRSKLTSVASSPRSKFVIGYVRIVARVVVQAKVSMRRTRFKSSFGESMGKGEGRLRYPGSMVFGTREGPVANELTSDGDGAVEVA